MHFNTLSQWLDYIKSQHPTEMDLSLERVIDIGHKLNILNPKCPVITVGGTNGKGSTVAGLESIYLAQKYKVGAFTTPFIFKFNEQLRINGKDISDDLLISAFEKIEAARGETTLTIFEFKTLAACLIFKEENLDIWLLEVGLGGRFDAVNAIDADIAVITSIGLDHTEWLGNTREDIALTKSGIFRPGKPAVCGDPNPPETLFHTHFYCQGKEFSFTEEETTWSWTSKNKELKNLPKTKLLLQNMSTVLMVIELMQYRLPVSQNNIIQGLSNASLPGRIQVLPGDVTKIFDVSHNPDSAELLATHLRKNTVTGKTHAVFSMLADKDIQKTLLAIKDCVSHWHIGPIKDARAASLSVLDYCFRALNISNKQAYESLNQAYQSALNQAKPGDQIVIFGSFRTVSEATST